MATYAILAAIVLGGMPHGGLDLLLARHRFALDTLTATFAFFVGYVTLAAAVVALWISFPTVALVLFLAYSALHFGGDLAENKALGATFAGLFVLGLPALTDMADTAAIFAMLGADGSIVATTLAMAGVGGGIAAALDAKDRLRMIGVMASLAMLSWLVPPLVYFFIYFCGIHAPLHVKRVSRECRMSERAVLKQGLTLALVAALAMAVAVFLLIPQIGWSDAMMRAVFIGFAALTVPHMLLVDLGPSLAKALERESA